VGSDCDVFVVDGSGRIAFASAGLRDRLGYERGELEGGPAERLWVDDLGERVRRTDDDASGRWVTGRLRHADGEPVAHSITVERTGFDGAEYLRLAVRPDGGDSFPAGPRFAAEFAREIAGAREREEVTRAVANTVARLLDTEAVCVREYDDGADRFETVEASDGARSLAADRRAFDLGATHAGRALRRGEPVVDTPTATGGVTEPVGVHLPVGEWGTVSAFLSRGPPRERPLSLVAEVCSLAAVALRRVSDGAAPSRERRADEPSPLRERLGSLADLWDIATAVAESDTKDSVLETLCRELAATDGFDWATVVETDGDSGWRRVADAGHEDRTEPASDDVFAKLAETGDGQGHAANGDCPEDVVVATVEGESYRGTLLAGVAAPAAVDETVRDAVGTLGRLAGHTVTRLAHRRLVLAEERLELEFEVTDRDCLAVPVSDTLSCRCSIEYSTLTSEGSYLLYLTVETGAAEAAVEAVAGLDSVTECRLVSASEARCRLEVRKPESGASAMLSVGATVREATAENGVGTLLVEAPPDADERAIADAYADYNPASRLVAKRRVSDAVRTDGVASSSATDRLTDKQRTALRTAYHAGYFEWPRGSTAEEVAASLGISPPTFHQHLRKALDEVLSEQLDPE
jgi:DNA-binding CsgD family transcriptional regulator